ncbi:MAG: hypothetical protein V3U65_04430 [Granulosicoccaceae bacterium]
MGRVRPTQLMMGLAQAGGIPSTLRDAQLRNIHTVMLTDGCAAFESETHDAAVFSLQQ